MHDGNKPNGAVAEMLAAEHEERPFGLAGAMLPIPELTPPPPVVESWRPPPPDWEQEAAEGRQAARAQADREAADAAQAEAERRLQAELAAAEQPESLPRRRGWMRKDTP